MEEWMRTLYPCGTGDQNIQWRRFLRCTIPTPFCHLFPETHENRKDGRSFVDTEHQETDPPPSSSPMFHNERGGYSSSARRENTPISPGQPAWGLPILRLRGLGRRCPRREGRLQPQADCALQPDPSLPGPLPYRSSRPGDGSIGGDPRIHLL